MYSVANKHQSNKYNNISPISETSIIFTTLESRFCPCPCLMKIGLENTVRL